MGDAKPTETIPMADNTGEATVDKTGAPEKPERREFLKSLPVLGIAWGALASSIGVVLGGTGVGGRQYHGCRSVLASVHAL